MREFIINSNTYRHQKLDAFTQLLISRKTAPIFIGMSQQLSAFDLFEGIPQDDLDVTLKAIFPFVERQQDVNGKIVWAKVYTNQKFAFEDICGGDLLEIMFAVLMDYLPDFFIAVDRMVSGTAQTTAENNTPQ